MDYFPLFADLRGVSCLVVGTGRMAEEKAHLLQRAGANIRRSARFCPDEARGAFLIMADVETAEAKEIRDFGKCNQIFVNIVDKPQYCSFIVPAIVGRGDLLLGISTSGKSPALSGWIRRKLEHFLGEEIELLLKVLGKTRRRVREALPSYADRKRLYYDLFDGGILEVARTGDSEHIERTLWEKVEEYLTCRSTQDE